MNRRNFIKSLASGIAGTAIVVGLPHQTILNWSPEWLKHETAIAFLRKAFNIYAQSNGKPPLFIVAGPTMFEEVEKDLIAHVETNPFGLLTDINYPGSLMFKGATLIESPRVASWDALFLNETPQHHGL